MKRSKSTISTGESPYSNQKRLAIGQKREVIQMLKSGKSSSSVALHFGTDMRAPLVPLLV